LPACTASRLQQRGQPVANPAQGYGFPVRPVAQVLPAGAAGNKPLLTTTSMVLGTKMWVWYHHTHIFVPKTIDVKNVEIKNIKTLKT